MQNLLLLLCLSITSVLAQPDLTVNYTYKFGSDPEIATKLLIAAGSSLHYFDDKREQGVVDVGDTSYPVFNDEWSHLYYRSPKNEKTTRQLAYYKDFVYETPPTKITLEKESKQIGEYSCQKATIQKGGRQFIAWFTTSVPISDGPLGIYGLPGMVVELTEVEGGRIEVKYTGRKSGIEQELMEKYRTFLSTQKVMTYAEYEKEATAHIVNRKRRALARYVERNITVSVSSERVYYQYLRDIPANLEETLTKLR